ncbi:probable protein phosphatase 2C 52 [Oryza brachyantha]|uniref:probable protein phosphatase 2C 52 n=1 Tax=Oryza brachyantha TaxID=4533 RepID=UPI001ADC6C28|nr:probable protein phosphatase 2C 52 [Oryza brachyantha]
MVYDGAVKDQESSANPASAASPALSEASAAEAAPSEVTEVAAAAEESGRPPRPGHDKRLGVRHPLKHRRFRAGGKVMVEPGDPPSAQEVVDEEASEVEQEALPVEREPHEEEPGDVEVSSAPVEMEVVEGDAMEEESPEPAVAVGDSELEGRPGEEEEEVSSPVVPQGERKQETAAAAPEPAMEEKKHKDQEKKQKEREREKERERVDEVGYMSGGWKSEDGFLSCGYSSFRGKRASMEDFYDIKSCKIDDNQISLFGIFDGHGGSRAAEYLKEHLFENLMKHPEFMTNTKLAISETYKKTDSDFLDSESHTHRDDGSTASTAVLVRNHLYVANVGDSRAVISKAGKAIALSEDHKPNRSDERKRIESAGGVVMWAGTWRVGGVLAMSRAFGNRLLKQFVVADPEIQEQKIDDELEFLILASDGLWDVVPNEDAVSLVKIEEEPEAAARKLTETAFSRGSGDNITCIVVKFQHDKMDGDSAPSGDKS